MISSTVNPPTIDRRCPREYLTNQGLHVVLLVEEAARRVGDGPVVVADLVYDHAAQVDADLLLRHARHPDLTLVGFE